MSLIDPVSVPQLAERLPHAPGRLTHFLAAEPLLGNAALAVAARMMPAQDVVCHACSAPEAVGAATPDIADMIATGGPASGTIVLTSIARLSAYRKLIDRVMAELAPVITRGTGSACEIDAHAVLSAPGAPTPFHFDAEYSLLFQIAGDKVFCAYPPAPPFLELHQREANPDSRKNRLQWHPEFAASGEQHLLSPGDALFVPYAAPHWVRAAAGRAARELGLV